MGDLSIQPQLLTNLIICINIEKNVFSIITKVGKKWRVKEG